MYNIVTQFLYVLRNDHHHFIFYEDKIRLKCINVSCRIERGTSKVFNECWNYSNYFIYDVCFPQWDEGRDLSVSFSMVPTACVTQCPGQNRWMFIGGHT